MHTKDAYGLQDAIRFGASARSRLAVIFLDVHFRHDSFCPFITGDRLIDRMQFSSTIYSDLSDDF